MRRSLLLLALLVGLVPGTLVARPIEPMDPFLPDPDPGPGPVPYGPEWTPFTLADLFLEPSDFGTFLDPSGPAPRAEIVDLDPLPVATPEILPAPAEVVPLASPTAPVQNVDPLPDSPSPSLAQAPNHDAPCDSTAFFGQEGLCQGSAPVPTLQDLPTHPSVQVEPAPSPTIVASVDTLFSLSRSAASRAARTLIPESIQGKLPDPRKLAKGDRKHVAREAERGAKIHEVLTGLGFLPGSPSFSLAETAVRHGQERAAASLRAASRGPETSLEEAVVFPYPEQLERRLVEIAARGVDSEA